MLIAASSSAVRCSPLSISFSTSASVRSCSSFVVITRGRIFANTRAYFLSSMTSVPIFPTFSRIFLVSEKFFDQQKLCPVVNFHYQAVVVMPDVENQQRLVLVGIRKV